MQKLIIVFGLIAFCQKGISQFSKFALGIHFDYELEHYENKTEQVFGQFVTENKFAQNKNLGFSLNYTFQKRIVLESGMSWVKRNYEQIRPFDAQSFMSGLTILPLYHTGSYSYKFIDIPLSVKVFLSKKDNSIKPFIEIGAKANYLTKADYTTLGNTDADFTDPKKTYWGWLGYGGFGVNYFWKKFIFEANTNYRFYQKSKTDTRFFDVSYVKFEDNYKPALSLGVSIYRVLDFSRNTPQ